MDKKTIESFPVISKRFQVGYCLDGKPCIKVVQPKYCDLNYVTFTFQGDVNNVQQNQFLKALPHDATAATPGALFAQTAKKADPKAQLPDLLCVKEANVETQMVEFYKLDPALMDKQLLEKIQTALSEQKVFFETQDMSSPDIDDMELFGDVEDDFY